MLKHIYIYILYREIYIERYLKPPSENLIQLWGSDNDHAWDIVKVPRSFY